MEKVSAGKLQVARVGGTDLGVISQSWEESGWASAEVKLLRTFSWDAKDRAFETIEIGLSSAKPLIAVCGPYATADAAAWNVDPDSDVGFPENKD
jgi:hypothetical protein